MDNDRAKEKAALTRLQIQERWSLSQALILEEQAAAIHDRELALESELVAIQRQARAMRDRAKSIEEHIQNLKNHNEPTYFHPFDPETGECPCPLHSEQQPKKEEV